MPCLWMVDTFNELFTSWISKVFNLFGISIKWMALFLKIKLRSVNLHWSQWHIQESLCPVHVCTWASSMVLHHTGWCKIMVDKVHTKWSSKTNSEDKSGFVVQIYSEFHSGIWCENSFFEILHVLCCRYFSAINWIDMLHIFFTFKK